MKDLSRKIAVTNWENGSHMMSSLHTLSSVMDYMMTQKKKPDMNGQEYNREPLAFYSITKNMIDFLW